MASLNKVFLMGNLTRDPEQRFTPGGAGVVEFGLAMNRQFKTQSGENREETTFVDITVWGRQGETCNQYLSKGRQVYIEGRLTTRTWKDKSDIERKTTEIVARDMQMLGSRGDGGSRPSGGSGGGGQAETPEFAADAVKIDDDDLPF